MILFMANRRQRCSLQSEIQAEAQEVLRRVAQGEFSWMRRIRRCARKVCAAQPPQNKDLQSQIFHSTQIHCKEILTFFLWESMSATKKQNKIHKTALQNQLLNQDVPTYVTCHLVCIIWNLAHSRTKSLVHIAIRDNTLHTLTDHEKIVLFHENILNREHYLKQSTYH